MVEWGAGPRASLALLESARALALLRGRDYILPDDVRDVAVDVMSHRILLSFDAIADGIDPVGIIQRILTAVPPPRVVWNGEYAS